MQALSKQLSGLEISSRRISILYKDQTIAVVVPAYNEELLIGETVEGMPEFVDYIFVINDASVDNTLKLINAQQEKDDRVILINHETNKGLGQSLIDGYLSSLDSDADITAVMAGDNQMHPDDLPKLLDRIIDDELDYVKGNRLLHHNIAIMPRYRLIGNAGLTILTKFATGYYFLMDPQCGYTAIRNNALRYIPIQDMTTGYGYNADILCMLNIRGFRVADIEVRPVYDREKSKINVWKYIPRIVVLLTRLFFRRLWGRYIIRDFHPLVLFYLFSFFSTIFIIIPLTTRFFYMYSTYYELPETTLTILTFTLLIAFQSILFAIWMDMDYNTKQK
jgi:glycosyltransferase involved in cell wall biosynthesis